MPKTIWQRFMRKELEEMGLTRGGAQAKAQDRSVWQRFVAALCPFQGEHKNLKLKKQKCQVQFIMRISNSTLSVHLIVPHQEGFDASLVEIF